MQSSWVGLENYEVTARGRCLLNSGFDFFPSTHNQLAYRKEIPMKKIMPLMRARLHRAGVQAEDSVFMCYDEGHKQIVYSVIKYDLIEVSEIDSPRGRVVLWSLGLGFLDAVQS